MTICFRIITLFLIIWMNMIPATLAGQGNDLRFEHFSQENGLTNNQVHCSFQDKRGFMWFGTSQGLSRFDGYSFTRFVQREGDSTSLQGNLVRVIFESKDGKLYIGTEDGGLNLFDRNKEVFTHMFDYSDEFQQMTLSVNDIQEDTQGRLWIGTDRGLIRYTGKNGFEQVIPEENSGIASLNNQFVRVITFDSSGQLWLGTNEGVAILDTLDNRIREYKLPLPPSGNKEIWELYTDNDGKLWIGTYENGIFIVDPSGKLEKHLLPDPTNNRSWTVRSIARDKKGDYWIGTRGGLFVFSDKNGIISSYVHDEREAKSLSGNSILDIFHDSRGDTWIGTRTGINYLIHSKQAFKSFRAMPDDNHYLNSNEVWVFWIAPDGKIWIGTEDGGVNIYDQKSGTFTYLKSSRDNPNSLSSNCIKSFLDDGMGNLWIATFRGGINVLKLATGTIRHFRSDQNDAEALSDDRVWHLYKNQAGEIWVATSSGVDIYNEKTGKFKHIKEIPPGTQVNWISQDREGFMWLGGRDEIMILDPKTNQIVRYAENSRAFLQDFEGRIWITTLDKGVALYSREKGVIRYFSENEGLANNQAVSILEDDQHFLWIGTTNGLSRFIPETGSFYSFFERDGLQNSQFNYGAALKSPTGELLFGGISGFNLFDPQLVVNTGYIAPIVFTDLKIFNKPVEIGTGNKPVLTRSISESSEIILPFSQKVFTIEFATLNFANAGNNLYSYYLEGFDEIWNDPSSARSATYTNLNPGEYVFHVKSVIPGIPDTKNDIILNIQILPPFWKTWVFKFLLFAFFGLLLFALVQFMLNREKLKNELIIEKLKAKKLHELDMLKLRFFTNISHEIRTPLTLILGPLEKLRSNQVSPAQMQPTLEIMYRNTKNLDQLINQILDFRKLETGSLRLDLTDGELVGFVKGIVAQFDHLAKEKEIRFSFHSLLDNIFCQYDPDKTEKIISNLLSNAFKFTETGGKISVHLAVAFENPENPGDGHDPGQRYIELTVRDSGKGIEEPELDKIFIRFFQGKGKNNIPGTGIGLALIKELVKLHNGDIFVTSKPGEGSKFTVKLPYREARSILETTIEQAISNPLENPSPANENLDQIRERIMLIIEDNSDVRQFIKSHFDTMFNVIEAVDGYTGWESALKTIPDIILCDILMPRVDGYELLKKLKNDERTSHIPVILLTALASKEHEMEGLTAGADDFITKPFDLAILQTKIENILSIRQSLKERYASELFLQPKNIMVTPPDERFLKRAIEIVEENIGDPDLDIEHFSTEVGVSRMQLYRKLNALTDMTVREFIRDIRLQRAGQLILQKKQTVSEIAYAVGFRDLSHFRKCFRQKFGMSATEYADSTSENTSAI